MNPKIKIIQVGFSFQHGGIESFALSYDPYINDDNVQVDYINVFPQAKNIRLFQELDSKRKVIELPDYRKKPFAYIKKFYKLQKKNKYDILHYNMNSASYLIPLIAAKIAGVPIRIAHAHNSSSDKGLLKEIVHNLNRRFIPLFANFFFSCSDLAGKWFYSSKIIQSKRYFRINNAIEMQKFMFDQNIRDIKRNEIAVNKDTVIIGHIGRFEAQKNHRFLIEIFVEYLAKNSNSLLLLIGSGVMFKDIKDYVSHIDNLKNKVLFLGQISNVNEYLNAMDIFLLPSLYEGFPYVGIEAQVNGLPCIFSSTITSELKQTENVIFENLSSDTSIWSKDIERMVNIAPRKTCNIYKYDIRYSADRIKKIYRSLINSGVCDE